MLASRLRYKKGSDAITSKVAAELFATFVRVWKAPPSETYKTLKHARGRPLIRILIHTHFTPLIFVL